MKRYLLISLGIGLAAALITLALYFLQVFEPVTAWLDRYFRINGIYPEGSSERIVWAEYLSILTFATWICWCLCDLTQGSQKLIVLVGSLLVAAGVSPTLALYGKFWDPFSTFAALVTGASAAFVFSGTELGHRKGLLEAVLGRRVSWKTFSRLMSERKPLSFESRESEVTVLTCRLFNRAELSSSLSPADFLRMTNLFRRVVSNYLALQGAYLDNAGPELVRTYFGLLGDEENHAGRAARAALGIKDCLRSINSETQARWSEELKVGVGISSGKVVAGIYGSKGHFFLSGIGPETDFSRRLSRANLIYGSDLLVGPGTYKLIADLAELRPMEMFYDPETGSMKEIYQLLAMKEDFGDDQRQLRDSYWQGVIHYREGKYKEALEAFHRSRVPGRTDGPLEYFILATQEKMGVARNPSSTKIKPAGSGHSRLIDNL